MILDTRHSYSAVISCDPVSSSRSAIIQLQLTSLRFASLLHRVCMTCNWHVRGRTTAEVWSHLCKTWLRRDGGAGPSETLYFSCRLYSPPTGRLEAPSSTLDSKWNTALIVWDSLGFNSVLERPVWLCDLVVEGKLCNSWLWSPKWLLGAENNLLFIVVYLCVYTLINLPVFYHSWILYTNFFLFYIMHIWSIHVEHIHTFFVVLFLTIM